MNNINKEIYINQDLNICLSNSLFDLFLILISRIII